MAARGGLIRLALFGAPVRHSLSPRIHQAFARQAGLAARYEAIETPAATLARALERFSKDGGAGCNITLPLKREALDLAAGASERARRAGAANTLIPDGAGGWSADNTDGEGLVRDLRRVHGGGLAGLRVAVFGAGGAAGGILAALLAEQPAELLLVNRTAQRALDLAQAHADLGAVRGTGLDGLRGAPPFDLVINATSLGHAGSMPPLRRALFAGDARCHDLNYGRAAAPLAEWCRARDISYRDGLGMLVEQAAASFELWTGFAPATAPVLATLRSECD